MVADEEIWREFERRLRATREAQGISKSGFGTKLRAIREAKRMTVTELAERVGVHQSYISKIELLGDVVPDWEKIVALGNALESVELIQFGRLELLKELTARLDYLIKTENERMPAAKLKQLKSDLAAICDRLFRVIREALYPSPD